MMDYVYILQGFEGWDFCREEFEDNATQWRNLTPFLLLFLMMDKRNLLGPVQLLGGRGLCVILRLCKLSAKNS